MADNTRFINRVFNVKSGLGRCYGLPPHFTTIIFAKTSRMKNPRKLRKLIAKKKQHINATDHTHVKTGVNGGAGGIPALIA